MVPTARVPLSRRERPAKPALTREGIVATAVRLTRTEGLERVTMRRLAQELDTGAASLYVYVRNTAELHTAVLDEMLGALELRPEPSGTWQERLSQLLTNYLMLLFEYPSLARAALVSRPTGPHYMGLYEAVLALLSEGEIPPARAAWAVDLLVQFATASAAEHSTRGEAIDAADDEKALAAALLEADAASYPHIAALGGELISGTGPERLAWGFDVLINGVLHTPRAGIRPPKAI